MGSGNKAIAKTATRRRIDVRITYAPRRESVGREDRSVARCAQLDPSSQNQNLPIGQVWRTVEGHAASNDLRVPCGFGEFLNDIARVRIPGNDANRTGFAAAWRVHQLIVGNIRIEVHASRWRTADVRMARHA